MHAGEEDHAQPGWTTSRRGKDSPWKSQSEWQRTDIDGESSFMVWPTFGSRTAEEENRTDFCAYQSAKLVPMAVTVAVTEAFTLRRLYTTSPRAHHRIDEVSSFPGEKYVKVGPAAPEIIGL